MSNLHVVTGAFGYSGKYIARGLLARGCEVAALMAGLLESQAPATGTIRLSEWAKQNKDALGRRYASEMRRRRKRDVAYAEPPSR